MKVSCLANIIGVIDKGQHDVYDHTETLTVLVTRTMTPVVVTSLICGSNLCLALVPMTIAWDLSGFRKRLLASSQRWIDWKQSLITLQAVSTECDVKLSVIGVLCIVDISEGCDDVGDQALCFEVLHSGNWQMTRCNHLTLMYWLHSLRYESTHLCNAPRTPKVQKSWFIKDMEWCRQIKLQQKRLRAIVCSTIDIQHSHERGFSWMTTPVCWLILAEVRDVTKFAFTFDNMQTLNVFSTFHIQRMFYRTLCRMRIYGKVLVLRLMAESDFIWHKANSFRNNNKQLICGNNTTFSCSYPQM